MTLQDEHERHTFESYLSDGERVIGVTFPDGRRREKLDETTWRVRLLPFEYTAYFPAAVWLGKITGWELVRGLLIEIAWLVIMIGVCRFVWWRGTKRYSGFGG